MPFFKQNWTLFAPEVPSDHYQILVYEGDELVDVTELIYDDHHSFPLLYKGKLAVGLYNWCLYLHREVYYDRLGYYHQHTDQFVGGVLDHLGYNEAKFRIDHNGHNVYRN